MIRIHALLWIVGVLASGECLATSPTAAQPASGSAAVLDEPGMPLRGCPSSPAVIAEILSAEGLRVDRVSAQQMADSSVLSNQNYDLLVLPTGETFPAVARDAVIQFLHGGGDLVTMGGYAFQNLVRQVDGQWKPEQEVFEAKLRDATRDDQSLVADGGFENADEAPIGGDAIDGRWRRSAACVAVSREAPYRGQQCGRVELSDENSLGSGGYDARVRVTPGRHYRVSGAVRATQLAGPGIAYIAVYQFDAQENVVDFRDFAVVREPCDWQAFAYQFVPSSRVDHVRIQCGFYRKSGVAFFDEIRLFDLTDVTYQPINTATGEPGDGLKVMPEQIGMFDPSYPLKRASQLRTAAGQSVVQVPLAIQQALERLGRFRRDRLRPGAVDSPARDFRSLWPSARARGGDVAALRRLLCRLELGFFWRGQRRPVRGSTRCGGPSAAAGGSFSDPQDLPAESPDEFRALSRRRVGAGERRGRQPRPHGPVGGRGPGMGALPCPLQAGPCGTGENRPPGSSESFTADLGTLSGSPRRGPDSSLV